MRAKLIKFIERRGSSNGADKCYILCFKGEDGKSYRSWTDSKLGNFSRWYNAIVALTACEKAGDELWMDSLIVRRNGEIDADSFFKMERIAAPNPGFIPTSGGKG